MMTLNNKGQSLVLFIVLIPIMILIMVLVIDIGNLYYNKKELDNIGYLVTSYGIDNYNEDDVLNKMIKLANLNDDNLSSVYVNNTNNIEVNLTKNVSFEFGKMFSLNGIEIKTNYIGDINSKKIKRIK